MKNTFTWIGVHLEGGEKVGFTPVGMEKDTIINQ